MGSDLTVHYICTMEMEQLDRNITDLVISVVADGLIVEANFKFNYEERHTVIPLELENGMELRLPPLGSLSQLNYLSIRNNTDLSIVFDMNNLCGLELLTGLSLRSLDLLVGDTECVALPNLRYVFISDCTIIMPEDSPYDNIVQLLADNALNIEELYMSNNEGLTGEWPTEWISNRVRRLYLSDNRDMPNLIYQ